MNYEGEGDTLGVVVSRQAGRHWLSSSGEKTSMRGAVPYSTTFVRFQRARVGLVGSACGERRGGKEGLDCSGGLDSFATGGSWKRWIAVSKVMRRVTRKIGGVPRPPRSQSDKVHVSPNRSTPSSDLVNYYVAGSRVREKGGCAGREAGRTAPAPNPTQQNEPVGALPQTGVRAPSFSEASPGSRPAHGWRVWVVLRLRCASTPVDRGPKWLPRTQHPSPGWANSLPSSCIASGAGRRPPRASDELAGRSRSRLPGIKGGPQRYRAQVARKLRGGAVLSDFGRGSVGPRPRFPRKGNLFVSHSRRGGDSTVGGEVRRAALAWRARWNDGTARPGGTRAE